MIMTREDGRGVAASRAAAQKERVDRGKNLLEGAEVGNLVCVLIQDMNHDGGMSEREKEQGGNLSHHIKSSIRSQCKEQRQCREITPSYGI